MDEPRTGRVVLWVVPILLMLVVAVGSSAAVALIGTPGPSDAPDRVGLQAIPSPDPVGLMTGASCAVLFAALAIRLARPRSGESMSGQ